MRAVKGVGMTTTSKETHDNKYQEKHAKGVSEQARDIYTISHMMALLLGAWQSDTKYKIQTLEGFAAQGYEWSSHVLLRM